MASDDVDRKEDAKIATVEITVEGKMVYKKSVFMQHSLYGNVIEDIAFLMKSYDEAK